MPSHLTIHRLTTMPINGQPLTVPALPTPSRIVSLEAGRAMVITDLHGDWDIYRRYRDHFLALQARGQADYVIFTGDLIHSDGPPSGDRSLDILLDLLALREHLGQRLIYLLGNHELPHLYGITLAKGDHVYTPRLEAAMGAHRERIYALWADLPFYVRTRAGVTLCHAGAAAELCVPGAAARVFNYSHRRVREAIQALLPAQERPTLRAGFAKLSGAPYDVLARRYLGISRPDDPHYDALLVGFLAGSQPDFQRLWATLFNRNEQQYGIQDYAIFVDVLLKALSSGYHPQTTLVSGHLSCRDGYTLVTAHQLRLASGPHAHPQRSARYLIFDVGRPVHQAKDLLKGLNSLLQ